MKIKLFIKKISRRTLLLCFNNFAVNNLLIFLHTDHIVKSWFYNWSLYKYLEDKSPEENVGCSQIPEIQEALKIAHLKLQDTINSHLKKGDSIFDLGCGAGLFLKDFEQSFNLFAIDMNKAFIEKAKELVPDCTYYYGNYLKSEIPAKFNAIYSLSVFQYIERSKLDRFFKKIAGNLKDDGILFLHYPHALRFADLLYPDLSYIRYSPQLIEKKANKWLTIIKHEHFYDNRTVNLYDKKRYYFPDGTNTRTDTVYNSYLLIAQKI